MKVTFKNTLILAAAIAVQTFGANWANELPKTKELLHEGIVFKAIVTPYGDLELEPLSCVNLKKEFA